MEDRRIAKDTLTISLTLADKSTMGGTVFLSQHKGHDSKPESVGDLLNKSEFIPVNEPDGISLVNVEKIVLAVVPSRQELDESADICGTRHMVQLRMLDGSSIREEILVELPEEANRVKDYLNQPDRFFRLIRGDSVLYVNRHYIVSVRD